MEYRELMEIRTREAHQEITQSEAMRAVNTLHATWTRIAFMTDDLQDLVLAPEIQAPWWVSICAQMLVRFLEGMLPADYREQRR